MQVLSTTIDHKIRSTTLTFFLELSGTGELTFVGVGCLSCVLTSSTYLEDPNFVTPGSYREEVGSRREGNGGDGVCL